MAGNEATRQRDNEATPTELQLKWKSSTGNTFALCTRVSGRFLCSFEFFVCLTQTIRQSSVALTMQIYVNFYYQLDPIHGHSAARRSKAKIKKEEDEEEEQQEI